MPLSPLRPLQEHAIDLLRASLRSGHKRPVIQAPCGFGKTVLAAHIITGALEKRNKVAFTVPRVALIDQTFKRFVQNGIKPEYMGIMQGDHIWNRPSAPIQICSVPTLASRGFPDVSFSIVDEAHLRYAVIDKWMTEQPDKIFVALSATPWANGMGDFWDDLIIPTSIGELIERKELAKFRIFNGPRPDLSGIGVVNTPNGRDYNEDQLSARYSAKEIVADVVSTWLKKGNNQPTLCYAVDRGHAQALQDQFLAAGVPSAYIDANTLRDERERIFQTYASGDVKIIVSIGTLTVGVDVDCRCLIMARRTMSEMLFVQIIGRALRTAEGKDFAIILDHTDNHYRLGLVTDIHHDTLHTSKNEIEQKEADEKEQRDRPKPFECPSCGTLVPYQARACECGWVSRRPNTVETAAGELREFTGGSKVKSGKREPVAVQLAALGMQEVYSQLLSLQGTKKPGWVTHNFFKLFDTMPPWTLDNKRKSPCAMMKSWIKSQRIAWIKGKEKYGDGGYPHAAE